MVKIFDKSFSAGPALTSLSNLTSCCPSLILLLQSHGPSVGSFLTRQALCLVGPLPVQCLSLHCFSYQISPRWLLFIVWVSSSKSPTQRGLLQPPHLISSPLLFSSQCLISFKTLIMMLKIYVF